MTDLLSALWRASLQGGIALVVIGLLALTLHRLPAALTCWLWRLGLLKCITGLFLTLSVAIPLLPSESIPLQAQLDTLQTAPVRLQAPIDTLQTPPTTLQTPLLIFTLYLLGLTLCLTRLALALARTTKLLRTATNTPHHALSALTPQFNLTRAPKIARSSQITSPMLALGIILLPANTRDDEPLILAHELAHVKRRDLFWELITSLIQALFWFHPLVWWAKREESLAREQAADALALANINASRADYARALLTASLQRSNHTPPLAIGAITRGSRLRRRLNALAQPHLPHQQALALGTLATLTTFCAFVPFKAVARQATTPARVTMRRPTPQPRTIEGRVQRPDRHPVANAKVSLVRAGRVNSGILAKTKTTADGTFRFPGTFSPEGLHLYVEAAGYAPTDRTQGGQITLEPELRWEAIVTDAQGRPLAGKKIIAVGVSAVQHALDQRQYEGFTNAEGRFSAEHLGLPSNPRALLFRADAPPLVIASMIRSQTEHTLIQRTVLVPGKTVSGRVVDTRGNPLRAVSLRFRTYKAVTTDILACRTDASGQFKTPLLPPGDYQFELNAPDKNLAPLHISRLNLPNHDLTDVTFTLTPGVTVRGKVTDGQTRKPIPNLHMGVSRTWDILKDGKPYPSGVSVSGSFIKTDAQGNYELHLPADKECTVGIQLDYSGPGKPQISHRFPDQMSRRIKGREGEIITANFAPAYARPLVGQVVDPSGKPIVGAQVNGFTTDSQGRFSIPEEQLGIRKEISTVTLIGLKDDLRGSLVVDAKSDASVRLILKEGQWITLRGQLVGPEGKLPTGAKLDVSGWGDRGTTTQPKVTLDATGNFTVRIEPGYRIELQALAPGHGWIHQSLQNNLPPGRTKDLGRLVLPRAPDFIAGRVVDAQGKPLTSGRIGVFGKQTLANTTLDSQGHFELTGLVPGDVLMASIQTAPRKPPTFRWNIPHTRRDLVFHLGGKDPYTDRKPMRR